MSRFDSNASDGVPVPGSDDAHPDSQIADDLRFIAGKLRHCIDVLDAIAVALRATTAPFH
jgi:hypothetical protein